jgi:hypothetical protein
MDLPGYRRFEHGRMSKMKTSTAVSFRYPCLLFFGMDRWGKQTDWGEKKEGRRRKKRKSNRRPSENKNKNLKENREGG